MTQTIASWKTEVGVCHPESTAEAVKCQKCDCVLGWHRVENGRGVLVVGNLSLIMAEGECSHCRTPFRWTSSQRALNRLLKHYPKQT